MQLRVEKCDGSMEVYLHTKVLGTLAAALGECGIYQVGLAERLAEAVSTYLRRHYGNGIVVADEIHSMILVVLGDTGFVDAALALQESRVNRQLKRGRVEVIHWRAPGQGGLRLFKDDTVSVYSAEPWNKSVVARDLEQLSGIPRGLARAIAGAVEEKILRLDCRTVTSSLVKELVNNELIAMHQADVVLANAEAMSQEPVAVAG